MKKKHVNVKIPSLEPYLNSIIPLFPSTKSRIQSDARGLNEWTVSFLIARLWDKRCGKLGFNKNNNNNKKTKNHGHCAFQAEHIRPTLLPWRQPGWIPVMIQSSVDSFIERKAGWTLISPGMFDRTACKNNTSPFVVHTAGSVEDQLLGGFQGHNLYFTPSVSRFNLWWGTCGVEGERENKDCIHMHGTLPIPYEFHILIKAPFPGRCLHAAQQLREYSCGYIQDKPETYTTGGRSITVSDIGGQWII